MSLQIRVSESSISRLARVICKCVTLWKSACGVFATERHFGTMHIEKESSFHSHGSISLEYELSS